MEVVAHHRSPRPASSARVTAALRRALAAGADRVELDVAVAGTELVIAHAAREVRGTRPLTLDEALSLLGGAEGPALLVDLKDAAAARTLGAALAARELGPRALVCGERRAALEAARAAGASAAWTLPTGRGERPGARAGPLALSTRGARARVRAAAAWAVADGGCAAVCVDRRFVDQPLVDAVHAEGGRVYAWTADRERELRRLAGLGVDGLVTNEVAIARRVRAAAGHER